MAKKILVILSLTFYCNLIFCQNPDIQILREINVQRNTQLDGTFRFITHTAIPIGIVSPLSLIISGLVNHDENLTNKGVVLGASILASVAFSTATKYIVARERPFKKYPDIQKATSAESFSFPSGHTAIAFSTATSLSLAFPKWYVIVPSYTLAAAVGYSRMHLGVHYPSDVLGGIIVGMGTSFATYKVQKWMKENRNSRKSETD